MTSAAYRHILKRTYWLFIGVDHLQLLYTALSELVTHDSGKRTDLCLVNIRYFHTSCIELIPCAHRAYHRNFFSLAAHYKLKLCCDRVNCVDNIIVLIKRKIIGVFGKEKAFVYPYVSFGIYLAHTLCHYLSLVFADGFSCGKYLAVEIGKTDLIIVNKVEVSNTAPDKRLTDITAYAAYAKYRYSRSREFFYCFCTYMKLCS